MNLPSFPSRRTACAAVAMLLGACSDSSTDPPDDQLDPVPEFTTLRAGSGYTCGLTAQGELWCWGVNASGRLGSGSSEPAIGEIALYPTPVAGGFRFSGITTGAEHMCGVTLAGAGYCWGLDFGMLGAGPRAETRSNMPVPISGGHTFRSIEASHQYTCGVTTANAGYCWGANDWHYLGTGDDEPRDVPTAVAGDIQFGVISSRLGSTGQVDQNSCGLDVDDAAWCWGGNQGGALGIGSADPVGSSVPVASAAGIAFSSISASGGYVCGISNAGTLYCWGRGNASPTTLPGPETWSSVSVGGPHSCAVSAAGDLYCWGTNNFGQLGIGGTGVDPVPDPTLVVGGMKWLEVSVGVAHTCAIATDHSAWCWGYGNQGELGIGDLPPHNPAIGFFSAAPVRVATERPRE